VYRNKLTGGAQEVVFSNSWATNGVLVIATPQPLPQPAMRCRCRPGADCWPSPSAWSELNTTVEGRLIIPISPIAACDGAGIESPACAAALEASTDPFWLQDQVMGSEKTGWLGAFDMKDKISEYAVAAETTEDVAAGVAFASKHNLRVAVKNTGHDYTGRSTANESLMIWVHRITGIEFEQAYKPHACSANHTEKNVVHIGAGERWVDVYTKGLEQSTPLYTMGGTCNSVGANGGYWMGGGWGMTTKQYGHAAANVIEAEVVLANGEVVIADECGPHAELFWALRGGGGGTFGVVTRVTMRAHLLPRLWGSCGGEIVVREHGGDKDADYAALLAEFFQVMHASMPEIKWGGSAMTGSYTGAKSNGGKPGHQYGTVAIGMDHTLPKAIPEAALRPLFSWAAQNPDKYFVVSPLGCNEMPSKCFWNSTCNPAWKHSKIFGDSKFWAPFDVEAATYNFAASDHYIPANAMADPVGTGLAAAIVNISNVGGHEGLNIQIEKGVYGASADVTARCQATSMHPGSNDAAALVTLNSFAGIGGGWHPSINGSLPSYAGLIAEAVRIKFFQTVSPRSDSFCAFPSDQKMMWRTAQVDQAGGIMRDAFPDAGAYANEAGISLIHQIAPRRLGGVC
jgi:hypothetical protein